ncbi:60S ribosomal protein L30 [Crotalus adamanteus]|uniref:60S ribosomal protein L30 n=1 Tax=Crotalus adamanteus TaxID=8729 RepID=A0AAW1CFY1_CROAD
MLAKTVVHNYSGNNIELETTCGKYYRVCTLAIIDPGDFDIPYFPAYKTTFASFKIGAEDGGVIRQVVLYAGNNGSFRRIKQLSRHATRHRRRGSSYTPGCLIRWNIR